MKVDNQHVSYNDLNLLDGVMANNKLIKFYLQKVVLQGMTE